MGTDVNNDTFVLISTKKSNKYCDKSTETDNVERRDQSTYSCERKSHETQTEKTLMKSNVLISTISNDVIDNILDAINENNVSNGAIFDKFNLLHVMNHVSISPKKEFLLENSAESIIRIEGSLDNAVALLYGELYHESWCFHTGKVVIVRHANVYTIPIAGCPFVARFSSRGAIAVGTVQGKIVILQDGEVLCETEASTFPVTSLHWLSLDSCVSSTLDGRVTLYTVKYSEIVEKMSTTFFMNDLPRKLRNSNNVSSIGITSLAVGEDLFVGGETGCMWRLSLEDFSKANFGVQNGCIEMICCAPLRLITLSSFAKMTVWSYNGSILSIVDNELSNVALISNNIVACSDRDKCELIFYDINRNKEMNRCQCPHAIFSVNNGRYLVTISDNLIRYYDIILASA